MQNENDLMKKVLARKKMEGLDLTITVNPSPPASGDVMEPGEVEENLEDKNAELAPPVMDAKGDDDIQGLLGEESPLHSNALRKKVLQAKKK